MKICSTSLVTVLLVTQLCPTLCETTDCSPPGSTIHGILQARILECIAISFSRDLSDPGLKPGSPALQADSLLSEPPGTIIREAQIKTTMGHHYQLEMTKIIKGVTISTVKDVKELEISYC